MVISPAELVSLTLPSASSGLAGPVDEQLELNLFIDFSAGGARNRELS